MSRTDLNFLISVSRFEQVELMNYREIERFNAISDSGKTYVVICQQEIVEVSSMSGSSTVAGMKRIILSTGDAVNYVNDRTFTVVHTGETIHRA